MLQNIVFILYRWSDDIYQWRHSLITRSLLKEVLKEFEKDDMHASLQQSIRWQYRCSFFETNPTNRDKFHTNWNGDECTMQYIGLIWDSRTTKDWIVPFHGFPPILCRKACCSHRVISFRCRSLHGHQNWIERLSLWHRILKIFAFVIFT